MRSPRRAVVLAAGLGQRMRPLTNETPKPLLPLWGVPLLERTLFMLEAWGVRHVLVNIHHLADRMLEHIRTRRPTRLQVDLSFEPEIMGTGGAIERASWFVDGDPLWIVNADVAAAVSPRPFLDLFAAERPLAVLWLHDSLGPRTVEMRDRVITDFASQTPGGPDTYTFCGLHLVSPRVLSHLSAHGASSIIDAYRHATGPGGERVLGICDPLSFWADMGTPASYLQTHERVRQARDGNLPGARLSDAFAHSAATAPCHAAARIAGSASLSPSVHVAGHARFTHCVVLDHAHIAHGASVRNAIIGPGARVTGAVTGVAVRASTMGEPRLCLALEALGWPPDRVLAMPLAVRGSDRAFIRIRYGQNRAVASLYGTERPENALHAQNARFLAETGIRVPEVLLDLPRHRTTVMEDVGDRSLLVLAQRPRTRRGDLFAHYRKAIDQMVLLQTSVTRAARTRCLKLCPPFSSTLYQWERELFRDHYLIGALGLRESAVSHVLAELRTVARELAAEPAVLLHRDLQSSNIFLCRRETVLIDFQAMRYGPAVYDLASLLCDPYVSLAEDGQQELLAYTAARTGQDVEALGRRFWLGAIQRLTQAIGAYARLAALPGLAHFRQHIGPALSMMERAIDHTADLPYARELVNRQLEERRP